MYGDDAKVGKEDTSRWKFILQVLPFACSLCTSKTRSALFFVIAPTARWYVVGSSGDVKFDASLTRVSTLSLSSIPR